ncbi:hypothetical protein K440DRAFT_671713 [Wilcoxina mikolae CBS 423.85]|nr:hypothetical protein K440DRAFT_671713 [Wilcoxina mikolae CBS 423.85]
MFCLNATSRRWFEQRHPDCQKPQDTEVKIGPNSVTYIRADMIRQASRGLFEYFEVSSAIAPVQVELALVGERIDCSIFKGLLHPDSVLVPETVKFPITLELKTSTADASTGEYTVVQILVEAAATYGNEQATEVREEAQTLVNWTFGQLQKSESSSTSVGAQNMLPASPSAARRFHKLKSISHSTHRSLLQILDSGPTTVTGYLPTVKRFELAYLLSLSVFQLHSSWTSRLNSRNIRVDDFSHFIIPDERKEAPHKRLPFDVFRHSRTDIFDLGVVLWEIGKGQPLDKRIQNKDEWLPCSWDPEDANSHRQKALADYLLDEVGPHMGIIYQEIVEWCFKVDFDNDPLGKDDIMRTFYCTVVEPYVPKVFILYER